MPALPLLRQDIDRCISACQRWCKQRSRELSSMMSSRALWMISRRSCWFTLSAISFAKIIILSAAYKRAVLSTSAPHKGMRWLTVVYSQCPWRDPRPSSRPEGHRTHRENPLGNIPGTKSRDLVPQYRSSWGGWGFPGLETSRLGTFDISLWMYVK